MKSIIVKISNKIKTGYIYLRSKAYRFYYVNFTDIDVDRINRKVNINIELEDDKH